MRVLSYFEEENTHHILIPHRRLLLFFLIILCFETAVCLSWNGIFIILSLFLTIPTVYLWRIGWSLWHRYYARVWYPLCLLAISAVAFGLRLLIYNILA